MKNIFPFILACMATIAACSKNENSSSAQQPEDPVMSNQENATDTLKVPMKPENTSIILPVGTIVQVAKDSQLIHVKLPAGYSFLNQNLLEQGRISEDFSDNSYTCTCSGSSTCKVFYQQEAGGFGCIHSTCTGSCTGSFKQPVMAILRTQGPSVEMIPRGTSVSGSLAPTQYEQFINSPLVQNALQKFYEKMSLSQSDLSDNSKTLLVAAQIYGVRVFIPVPKTVSGKLGVEYDTSDPKATCSCNESQGNCKKRQGGVIWVAYWCEGTCNGCTLTIKN